MKKASIESNLLLVGEILLVIFILVIGLWGIQDKSVDWQLEYQSNDIARLYESNAATSGLSTIDYSLLPDHTIQIEDNKATVKNTDNFVIKEINTKVKDATIEETLQIKKECSTDQSKIQIQTNQNYLNFIETAAQEANVGASNIQVHFQKGSTAKKSITIYHDNTAQINQILCDMQQMSIPISLVPINTQKLITNELDVEKDHIIIYLNGIVDSDLVIAKELGGLLR